MPLSKEKYFIEIVYQVEQAQNAKLHFVLDHLRINLCLPYILKLYQMAMDAISPNKPPVDTNPSKPSTGAGTDVSVVNKTMKDKKKSVIASPSEIEIQQIVKEINNSILNVSGKVNLQEVILFAEPEKFNSKVLIMNVNFLKIFFFFIKIKN